MATENFEHVYSNVGRYAPVSTDSFQNVEYIVGNVGYYIPTTHQNVETVYSNVGRYISVNEQNVEYVYGYVDPTRPPLEDGPNWAAVDAGTVQWIPGTIYNNKRFVRYRMWDGTKWQTS